LFKKASLKEKQRHILFDRGAGSDTAFSSKEIKKIMDKKVKNSNEAILEIVKHEQLETEGLFGANKELSWKKFIKIAPDIKRDYLEKSEKQYKV